MKNRKLFVYGALMAKHKDKQTAFPAYLKGHKVSFEVIGRKIFEPSFATLVAAENSTAYGIIIELSEKKLTKYIAHEVSYIVKNVEAIDMNGVTHQCSALFLNKAGYPNEVAPSARYADLLHKGGAYHGLPQNVLDYYLSLKKKGHKLTYFLRFLFPLYLKCMPHMGKNIAFYSIMILMPVAVVAMALILVFKYLI